MISNTLGIGLHGVQQGIAGMDAAARKIANAGVQSEAGSPSGPQDTLIQSLTDLRLYERSVEASSQVVKTADEMVGTLLDELV